MDLRAYLAANAPRTAVLLALILVLPITAYSEEYSIYTRHSHGWTVEYPAEWEIDAIDPNHVEISDREKDALCGIQSGNTIFTSVDELTEYVLNQTKALAERQGGPVPSVLEKERIQAPPSVPGIRTLVAFVPGGISLRSYFVHSGKLIIVDCETFTSKWELVSPAYIRLLNSISFEITPAALAYEQGLIALQEGDDGKAFEHLLEAAEGGDARAQYGAGILSYQGRGTENNLDEAMAWLHRAAQQGQLDAQAAIWQIRLGSGTSYQSKAFVEDAFFWMQTAAENGHLESQFQFAMQLLHGGSVLEKDVEEALRWLLEVARRGDAHAQHEAGAILFDESNAMFDKEAAYAWLSLAVLNGRVEAADLQKQASSHLSPERRTAIDGKVTRCLDTKYSECDF